MSGVPALLLAVTAVATSLTLTSTVAADAGPAGFIGGLGRITTVASTVPRNGDVNPYGVAVVPRTTGRLVEGDVLVSNFNAASNEQGTGTTIVEIAPTGRRVVFATVSGRSARSCPGGVGLSTALVALRAGWVIVGSLPTTNGMAATARAGCLLVLDSSGRVREVLTGHGINGPWDATAADGGTWASLFVSTVLNGTVAAAGRVVHRGSVLRLGLDLTGPLPRLTGVSTVASGLAERTDPAALVVGPTGLTLGRDGTLYLADTVNSRLAAVPLALSRVTSAGIGATVRRGGALTGPLGLATAPGGDLLAVNGANGEIVEVAPTGRLVATRALDRSGSPPGAGALFGLAVTTRPAGVYFVDDATNTLRLLH